MDLKKAYEAGLLVSPTQWVSVEGPLVLPYTLTTDAHPATVGRTPTLSNSSPTDDYPIHSEVLTPWAVDGSFLSPATPLPSVENPKTRMGAAKPSLDKIPTPPLFQVGAVMETGAAKYGPYNWRQTNVPYSTYYNGALRHLMAAWDGQDLDPETGIEHLAHAAAGLLIILDAKLHGTLVDDRYTPGKLAAYIAANTKQITKEPQ